VGKVYVGTTATAALFTHEGEAMRDPVYGMTDDVGALTVAGTPHVGFCSERCRQAYIADPDSYADASDREEHSAAYEQSDAADLSDGTEGKPIPT
jgi:hypothetical protein